MTTKNPRDVVDAAIEIRQIVEDVAFRDMPSGARAALGLVHQAARIAWQFGLGPRLVGLPAERAAEELQHLAMEFGAEEVEGKVADESVEVRAHRTVASTGVSLGLVERVAMARLVLAGVAAANERGAVTVGVQHQRFAVIDLLEQFSAAEDPLAHDRVCDLIEATVGLRPPEGAMREVLRGISGGTKWESIHAFLEKLGVEVPADADSLRTTYSKMKSTLHLDP